MRSRVIGKKFVFYLNNNTLPADLAELLAGQVSHNTGRPYSPAGSDDFCSKIISHITSLLARRIVGPPGFLTDHLAVDIPLNRDVPAGKV